MKIEKSLEKFTHIRGDSKTSAQRETETERDIASWCAAVCQRTEQEFVRGHMSKIEMICCLHFISLQNIIDVLAKYIFLCSKSPIARSGMRHKYNAIQMLVKYAIGQKNMVVY